MMEWKKIESGDDLPPEREYVLTCQDGQIGISRFIDDEWEVDNFKRRTYTKDQKYYRSVDAQYWMELPKAPEG
jgi:hypothetical protein